MEVPSNRMVPDVGVMRPEQALSSDDFPAPLAPARSEIVPGRISS